MEVKNLKEVGKEDEEKKKKLKKLKKKNLKQFFFKLASMIMVSGYKSKSINLIKDLFNEFLLIKSEKKKNILSFENFLDEVLKAVNLIKPMFTFKSVRRGSVIFRAPFFYHADSAIFRGLKFMVKEARERNKCFVKAFLEIMDEIFKNKGKLIERRKHLMLELKKNSVYRSFIKTKGNRRRRGKRKFY